MIYKPDGSVCSTIMQIPSITPWKSPLPYVTANNPAMRNIYYDLNHDNKYEMYYYDQYYLNLTDANNRGKAEWTWLYDTAQKPYFMNDLSATSWNKLLQQMKTDKEMFKQYYVYNSIGFDTSNYNPLIHQNHLCAMEHVKSEDYLHCMAQFNK